MKEIAAALIAAQKELPLVIGEDSVGHHSNYASLETIIERVRPILNKHGLTLSQSGASADGQFICETTIMHTSGESLHGCWPIIEARDPKLHPAQAMGQGWTYARRYSLAAILGIGTGGTGDQDVDASEPPKEEQRQAQQQQGQQEPTFSAWFAGQIAHYRTALGAEFDGEVQRRGVGDLDAIKTKGDAKALIAGLKNEVAKRAAQ